MLTMSLVNDILAGLQHEHEACKATVKHEGQHHQRMYVMKNKRELPAHWMLTASEATSSRSPQVEEAMKKSGDNNRRQIQLI